MFLGQNYVRLADWERLLGKNRLSVSRQLHDAAWALKMPYLEWLEDAGKQYQDDPAWWYCGVAEKDTTCNDFFLNLCYLCIAIDMHEKEELPATIVIDSAPLLLAMGRHLRKLGYEVKVPGTVMLLHGIFLAGEWARFFASWIVKLGIIARRVTAARQTKHLAPDFPADTGKPRALLFFWVNDADMGENGVLRNAYFTQLPGFLKSRGYETVSIARPHKTRRSFRSAFAWLRKQGDVLVPEDFMRLQDIIAGIRLLLRMYRIPKDAGDFKGIDLRDLLQKERMRQASHAMFIQFLAYGSMIAQLKARGFRIDAFLFPFENMALEKPITAALHAHYPNARAIGFQHTTVTPFMLKFSAWKNCFSAGARYFPDEIVCNGPGYRRGLTQSGFPASRMTVGPALRYLYLWKDAGVRHGDPSVVLVTLPLSFPVAVEVLGKALELSLDRSIPVAVKAHPFNDRMALLAKLGLAGLPDGVRWCEGPMSEWLGKAICMLSLGSGTLVEAVCSGVPIVILGAESGLQFNPLGWWEQDDPMFAPVCSLDEVRQRIRYWMQVSPQERKEKMESAASFMLRQFASWNESEVEALAASWLGLAARQAGIDSSVIEAEG